VKEALRMRPDRLIVGEVRDAEALDLLLALHTGACNATMSGALTASSKVSSTVMIRCSGGHAAISAASIVVLPALQGRQPSLEGTGAVSLRRLVKEALRMRPDRLIVGSGSVASRLSASAAEFA
jgi:pilus assembly protein CpaF